MQETRVWSLGQEDPLEKGRAPVFLPGEFHEQRSQVGYNPWSCRVRHNWAMNTFTFIVYQEGLGKFPLLSRTVQSAHWPITCHLSVYQGVFARSQHLPGASTLHTPGIPSGPDKLKSAPQRWQSEANYIYMSCYCDTVPCATVAFTLKTNPLRLGFSQAGEGQAIHSPAGVTRWLISCEVLQVSPNPLDIMTFLSCSSQKGCLWKGAHS